MLARTLAHVARPRRRVVSDNPVVQLVGVGVDTSNVLCRSRRTGRPSWRSQCCTVRTVRPRCAATAFQESSRTPQSWRLNKRERLTHVATVIENET